MSAERCDVCGREREYSRDGSHCKGRLYDECVRAGYRRQRARADSLGAELARVTAERDEATMTERNRCIRVAMEFADGFPESRWGDETRVRREVAQDVADYIGFTGDGRRGAGTHAVGMDQARVDAKGPTP